MLLEPKKPDQEVVAAKLARNALQFDHLPGPGEYCTVRVEEPDPNEPDHIERGIVMDIFRDSGCLEVKLPGQTIVCHISDLIKVG